MKKLLALAVALMLLSPGAYAKGKPVRPPPSPVLTRVDALVLYTDATLVWAGSLDSVRNVVAGGELVSNQVFTRSKVNAVLNVVAVVPSPVQESGSGMANTHTLLRSSSAVAALREQYKADVVFLISTDTGWWGYASAWYTWDWSGVTSYDAYAVVLANKTNTLTFTHELGHMVGVAHNREDANGVGVAGYAYGYRVCAEGGFLDVMSYPCPGLTVPQIPYFSNPNLTWNGQPIGIKYDSDPYQASDNARAINEFVPKVMAVRNP
jgi:hypothetical protein